MHQWMPNAPKDRAKSKIRVQKKCISPQMCYFLDPLKHNWINLGN